VSRGDLQQEQGRGRRIGLEDRVTRWLNRVAGSLLLAFGVKLALSR